MLRTNASTGQHDPDSIPNNSTATPTLPPHDQLSGNGELEDQDLYDEGAIEWAATTMSSCTDHSHCLRPAFQLGPITLYVRLNLHF